MQDALERLVHHPRGEGAPELNLRGRGIVVTRRHEDEFLLHRREMIHRQSRAAKTCHLRECQGPYTEGRPTGQEKGRHHFEFFSEELGRGRDADSLTYASIAWEERRASS